MKLGLIAKKLANSLVKSLKISKKKEKKKYNQGIWSGVESIIIIKKNNKELDGGVKFEPTSWSTPLKVMWQWKIIFWSEK